MTLRLLKEVQLASTLTSEEMASLRNASLALGKPSIIDLLESFRPTDKDYAKWLSVIVGHAADNKININRKNAFMDVAFEMFENDPFPPPADMEEMIVVKLWADYQAARRGTRIEQVARAQEDEEQLDKVAQEFSQTGSAGDLGDGDDDLGDDDLGDDDLGDDDLGDDDLGDDDLGDDSEESDDPYETYKSNGGTLDREAFDKDTEDLTDEEFEQYIKCGDECDDEIGNDEIGNDDLDLDFDGIDDDPIDPEVATIADRIINPNKQLQIKTEEEEQTVAPNPGKARDTFLKSMITSPKDKINGALKQVELDAASAWKAHEIPQNPHPKGSMAFRSWERGLKNAARDHFGFVPTTGVTSKPRSKKR